MGALLTWKEGSYSSHVGEAAGGLRLFGITWKSRREDPDWLMRTELPGYAGHEWRDNDRARLQGIAEDVLAAWIAQVTGPAAEPVDEAALSLAGVRRGDTVWVYSHSSKAVDYQQVVTAAGPKWVTVASGRFDREFGGLDSGVGGWRIETPAAHADRLEREGHEAVLAEWGWHPRLRGQEMTTAQLRQAAAMLRGFAS